MASNNYTLRLQYSLNVGKKFGQLSCLCLVEGVGRIGSVRVTGTGIIMLIIILTAGPIVVVIVRNFLHDHTLHQSSSYNIRLAELHC